MELDTLRPILSGLAGAAVVFAIRAAARRARPDERAGIVVLTYPLALRILSSLGLLVFGAFAIRNAIHGSAVNSYAVALAVPSVLALLSGYVAIECWSGSVQLGDESFRVISLWWRRHDVAWRDVTNVSFSDVHSCWVVRTRTQKTVRVSSMLSGCDLFVSSLEKRGIRMRHD